MAMCLRRRTIAAAIAASLLASVLGQLLPSNAYAASTALFNQPFHNATADGDGAVVLPTTTATNVACLTAAGNTSVVPKSCPTDTDSAGSGKLRLTDIGTGRVGGLFAATSVPTVSGLDVSFNTYQYGNIGTPADGIAFSLAAVDPANPRSPSNTGYSGGSLGYSSFSAQNGLAYGYLGIGFDVFGNFSNPSYQGSGCTNPAYASGIKVPAQVVIRGPGNLTAGYCAINSTASTVAAGTANPVPLRATTRTASKVPVRVLINRGTSSFTTATNLTVPAKSYLVAFTPVGQAQRLLTGTLPVITTGVYPASWLDADGYPRQLAFGFVASTGGSVDFHEIDETRISTLNAAVPELKVEQTAYTAPTLAPGDPVTYAVTAGVDAGVDETAPVSVTDTLPPGVKPVGGSGTGWVCAAPVGQQITCTNSNGPFRANTNLSPLTITGTVTGAAVTPATIGSNSVVTASSNDANPAYSNTAAAGASTNAPSNLVLTPNSGPSGTVTTITGTNTAAATAVQIGTSAELSAGTGTTFTPCPGNVAAAGCFTISSTTGAIGISAMPTHAIGAVQVKVVTLGAASTVSYTYTSVPGTPTVTATAGVTSATASWNAPASGGSAITGYTLTPYKDGVAQTAVQLAATATSYPVSGATVGSSYTFTVAARNSNGTGVVSVPSNAVVPYTLPGAPTSGTAAAGTSGARVTWTAPANNGSSAITGYVVTPYLNLVAQTPQSFDSTATAQTLTGLTPGASYTFAVAAINAAGTGPLSGRTAAVVVNDGPTLSSTPGRGEVGVAYSHQLVVSGGTAGYTYALDSGSLPDGVTLSSAGLLAGTPTAPNSFAFAVKVTDSYGASSTRGFTLVIAPEPSLTFASALPAAEVGAPYSQGLSRTGGTGPFAFSVSAGTLPAGLSLDATTGVISGQATQGGSYAFTVRVVDSFGRSDTKAATLVVKSVPAMTLAASDSSARFGTSVTLTATLNPAAATGTVTFTEQNPAGETVVLGTGTTSSGTATLTVTLPSFGAHPVVASYGGDGRYLGVESAQQVVQVNGYRGQAVITEFRTSGPAGGADSYVELYNAGPPMPLAGLVLESSSGTTTVLPADAPELGTYRTYLVAGQGFSLGALATPDLTRSTLGSGGLRLAVPDTGSTVTDAVGPSSGFHFGAALPAFSGTPNDQWAYVRIESAGRPTNTAENKADFALVSSTGARVGGIQSMRGSASPAGLADAWQHNSQALSYLLDPSNAVAASPNREYVVGNPGTLEIRRTITNTGTSTITEAKARITALSEANGLPYAGRQPVTPALIRAVNPKTVTSTPTVPGRGTVTVRNLSIDAPITAAAGGGLNSTFSVPLPPGGLAPGASVDVAFTFAVDTRGTFWFGYDIDARTASAARAGAKISAKSLSAKLSSSGHSKSKAVIKTTTGRL